MIVTVTGNPALDITYTLDQLRLGESHRVERYDVRAGGKGINVASVLRRCGYEAAATGPLGGATGQVIAADLRARGIDPGPFVSFDGESRRTVNLLTGGAATMLNEAGPVVDPAAWDALERRVGELLTGPGPAVLVLAGSLPRQAPADTYARLLRAAGPDTVTIVDTSGPALGRACQERPTLVKPNRAELAETTGRDDPLLGARELRRRGAEHVIVTDGPRGFILVPADGPPIRARLTTLLAGNPTGAGDALAAALASTAFDGLDMLAAVRRAAAWSAAAVLQPLAGEVDPLKATELLPHVVLEEIA